MRQPTFSILITTKNRLKDLEFTLQKIRSLLIKDEVECIICDDGSTDGTAGFIGSNYPEIQLISNPKSQGLIYSRNRLLNLTKATYAISLDDDAHFMTDQALDSIQVYFEKNIQCGVVALRIFWGLQEPKAIVSKEKPEIVQGFVGCAHVWRMTAWRSIPNYPAWFIFYGEENFASYQLFKKKWQVHYFPAVLVNHRVDIESRKNYADYVVRQRRSLRSGWYLFFLFYPIGTIPRKMAYSIWMQFKLKVFKGDFKALKAIILALLDLVLNAPRILKYSNRLSQKEYDAYNLLSETKVYWQEEKTDVSSS